MRRAAKVDGNQKSIVEALRHVGATVQPLHMVGRGCPDILVGYRGVNYLLEIKLDDVAPSASRLNADQFIWHSDWRGQCCVVRNIDEALTAIGAFRW